MRKVGLFQTLLITFITISSGLVAQKDYHHLPLIYKGGITPPDSIQRRDAIKHFYKISDKVDDFTKIRIIKQSNNYIRYSFLWLSKEYTEYSLQMNISISMSSNLTLTSSFIVVYIGKYWISIPSGNSLKFLIDDELIELCAPKESVKEIFPFSKPDGIMERIEYDINFDIMSKIVNGKIVKARLQGKNSYHDYVIQEDVKNNWREFLVTQWEPLLNK